MKTDKNLIIIIVILFTMISSCEDNVIELDKKNLTIYSTHGFVISYLNVDLEMSEQAFTILKKDGVAGNNKIKLDSIGNDYYIKGTIKSSHLLTLIIYIRKFLFYQMRNI